MNIFAPDSDECVLPDIGRRAAGRTLAVLMALVLLAVVTWLVVNYPRETGFVVYAFVTISGWVLIYAAVAWPFFWMWSVRIGPLRLMSRGIDHLRAAGYCARDLAGICWHVARQEWPKYILRARELR